MKDSKAVVAALGRMEQRHAAFIPVVPIAIVVRDDCECRANFFDIGCWILDAFAQTPGLKPLERLGDIDLRLGVRAFAVALRCDQVDQPLRRVGNREVVEPAIFAITAHRWRRDEHPAIALDIDTGVSWKTAADDLDAVAGVIVDAM